MSTLYEYRLTCPACGGQEWVIVHPDRYTCVGCKHWVSRLKGSPADALRAQPALWQLARELRSASEIGSVRGAVRAVTDYRVDEHPEADPAQLIVRINRPLPEAES